MPDFAHVDRWHWGPSGDDEATYWTAESFCESTAVESDENGLKVEFASYTDPTTALYATLGDLMADLELIESYRAGQPLPALPHAATVTPAPSRAPADVDAVPLSSLARDRPRPVEKASAGGRAEVL